MNNALRSVRVFVPDDDTAERSVRYLSRQLRDGQEVIILDYDPVIPADKVPEVIAQIVAFLKIQEARYRG